MTRRPGFRVSHRFGRTDTHGWGLHLTRRPGDYLYLDLCCGNRTYWVALWRI